MSGTGEMGQLLVGQHESRSGLCSDILDSCMSGQASHTTSVREGSWVDRQTESIHSDLMVLLPTIESSIANQGSGIRDLDAL